MAPRGVTLVTLFLKYYWRKKKKKEELDRPAAPQTVTRVTPHAAEVARDGGVTRVTLFEILLEK